VAASALFLCAEFCFAVGVNFRVPLVDVPSAEAWAKAQAGLRAKGGRSCPLEAYDFSGVPDDDLQPCVYYEYARESARITEAVDPLRKQMRERMNVNGAKIGAEYSANFTFKKFTKKHGSHYDAYFLLALAGCSGFPEKGWASLSEEDHRLLTGLPGGAIKMHNQHFQSKYPVFISEVLQDGNGLADSTLATWVEKKTPLAMRKLPEMRRHLLLSGFFMVNFLHSPEQIVDSFRKWLLKRHPRASEKVPEKRGRNSQRDRLNALGAMRLQFHCRTLSEAQGIAAPLRSKEHGLYYCDRTAWNRACKRAVEYFREVLDASPKDFPIHYSAGWQK